MSRAERRRAEREALKKKTKTYNLTQEQLEIKIREGVKSEVERIKLEATENAIDTAMYLLLALPLTVLKESYWQKSYAKRLPKFTEQVIEYYKKWQDGEIDIEELKKDLWEYGGVRIEESE